MENTKTVRKTDKNGHSLIFTVIGVLIAAVIVLGIAVGAVIGVRNSRAVMRYEGVRLNEGELNYLLFSYKYDFLASFSEKDGVIVSNSQGFFESTEPESGRSYGELLNEWGTAYVKNVMVGAYLFDRYSSLDKNIKERLDSAVEERITQVSGGDKNAFDDICAEYGFDSGDMRSAIELVYKYKAARTEIYGEDGGVLSLSDYSAECNEYLLSSYAHVKLLFVSTEHRYVKNDAGEYVEMDLDPDGVAEAVSDIERIRELITGYNMGAGEQMSPVAFEKFEEKYLFIPELIPGGYYFSASSEYSAYFESKYENVVTTALAMDINSYAETEWEEGVCFIYRYPVESGAYSFSINEDFFGDFYSDASEYLYGKTVSLIGQEVIVKDGYKEIDITVLPYDFRLYCRI